MPRPAKPSYIPHRPGRGGGYWITRAFGEYSEKTGRRKGIRNTEIGPPTGREGPSNRAAAQKWVDLLAEGEAMAERRVDNPTFRDLAEAFCDWSAKSKELRTVKGHGERLATFRKFTPPSGVPYGDRAVRDLRATDLSRFLAAQNAAGYSPVYTNSIVLSVMACLNWACAPIADRTPERILPANPFAGVKRPTNPAPPKRYAGSEARRAFLRYARARACSNKVDTMARRFDRLTVELLRFCEATGCRPSEACRLEWSHIDRANCRATLKGKSTGKTGKKRVLPLTERTLRVLGAIERLPGRHERFVFTHQSRTTGDIKCLEGRPWSSTNALAHLVRRWREEAIAEGERLKTAGKPTHGYDAIASVGPAALTATAFRRDMGADVLRLTKSHAASAEVLGHSVAVNEKHYSSFAEEYAIDLARQVDNERRRST